MPAGPDAEARRRLASRDPLAALAQAGGYDDAERWWEDVVEGRLDSSSPFPLVLEAMGELRRLVGNRRGRHAEDEARREAYMRQTIRAALKRGRTRVAVVCGAWHAPVLTAPLGPAAPGRPAAARAAEAQGRLHLGALDAPPARRGQRLRRRHHLARLVRPPVRGARRPGRPAG